MSDAARPKVHVVRTGTANLASVVGALDRQGVTAVLTSDARELSEAHALVLPGVGSFAAAIAAIDHNGLAPLLRDRVATGRPTLCICLGLQVLFEESEESPGVRGLGAVYGRITRFSADVRVPQLGWNAVEADQQCRLLRSGVAYYANSYRADQAPAGWSAAWTDHGGRFIAAIERGPVLACQFHPELSGPWGAAILSRWLLAAGFDPALPAPGARPC